MEPFEYVVVLTSLILGLGIAQILVGVSGVIANFKTVKFGLAHSLLTLIVFLTLIQEWWIDYQYSKIIETWTMPVVLTIITYPIILFFTATILFPPGLHQDEKTDLYSYYFKKWPIFFLCGLASVLISLWQNVYISGIPVLKQYAQLGFILCYSAFLIFKIENRIAHAVYLGGVLLIWIVYISTLESVL